MFQAAFVCLLVGQVPPPPLPQTPEQVRAASGGPTPARAPRRRWPQAGALAAQTAPVDQPPPANDPKAQREWLLARLTVDLAAQGKLDQQKAGELRRMINGVSDVQIAALVQYYQAQELARAKANLARLQAYRDALKREVDWKIATSRQEQAMAAAGPPLAVQSVPFVVPSYYAAPPAYYVPLYYARPYAVYRPYYYAPYPRYYRHW